MIHTDSKYGREQHQKTIQETLDALRTHTENSIWRGVTHSEIVEAFESNASKRGWLLANYRSSSHLDGLDTVGSWDVSGPRLIRPTEEEDSSLALGYYNCHSRTRSPQSIYAYAGLRLTDGDVGIVFNEWFMGRHTILFDAHDVCWGILAKLCQASLGYPAVIRSLHNRLLERKEWNRFLLDAGRKGLMPWSRLSKVDELFQRGMPSSWNLLTAFASVAKQNPPLLQMRQVHKFYLMLPTTKKGLF